VSYASERILWMKWIRTKWQISVLDDIHIMLPFYLILTRGPIIIVKKNLRVILSSRMLLRWFLGVCFIRVLAKNHGDPYYEPTIVVHDTTRWRAGGLWLPDVAWTSQVQKYLGLTIVTMAARRIIHNQHNPFWCSPSWQHQLAVMSDHYIQLCEGIGWYEVQ